MQSHAQVNNAILRLIFSLRDHGLYHGTREHLQLHGHIYWFWRQSMIYVYLRYLSMKRTERMRHIRLESPVHKFIAFGWLPTWLLNLEL